MHLFIALDVLPGGVSPVFMLQRCLCVLSACLFIYLSVLGKASPELELSSQYQ